MRHYLVDPESGPILIYEQDDLLEGVRPKVWLWLSSREITLTEIELPMSGDEMIRKALPFALEPFLISPIESLYFAFVKGKGKKVHVALLDRAILEKRIQELKEHVGDCILMGASPDLLLLPFKKGHISINFGQSHAWVRTSKWMGFCLPSETLVDALSSTLAPHLTQEFPSLKPEVVKNTSKEITLENISMENANLDDLTLEETRIDFSDPERLEGVSIHVTGAYKEWVVPELMKFYQGEPETDEQALTSPIFNLLEGSSYLKYNFQDRLSAWIQPFLNHPYVRPIWRIWQKWGPKPKHAKLLWLPFFIAFIWLSFQATEALIAKHTNQMALKTYQTLQSPPDLASPSLDLYYSIAKGLQHQKDQSLFGAFLKFNAVLRNPCKDSCTYEQVDYPAKDPKRLDFTLISRFNRDSVLSALVQMLNESYLSQSKDRYLFQISEGIRKGEENTWRYQGSILQFNSASPLKTDPSLAPDSKESSAKEKTPKEDVPKEGSKKSDSLSPSDSQSGALGNTPNPSSNQALPPASTTAPTIIPAASSQTT